MEKIPLIDSASETMGCWQKYDRWVWNSDGGSHVLFRQTKIENSVRGSKCASDVCLLWYRAFAMIIAAICSVDLLIRNIKKGNKGLGLQYFTQWGVHLTTIFFTLAFITSVRYRRGSEDKMRDSTSVCNAWKMVSSLFMTALLWECIIVSIYWSLLYENDKARMEGQPALKFWNIYYHALILVILIIEWSLNRIFFELNQIWANLAVFLIYGMINIIVTYVND